MTSLAEGTLITPSVRLVRPLRTGGMGSVWVADHLGLKTQVVVKFIAPELADRPEAAARFEREAAAGAQVKSPHVVQVFDHGTSVEHGPYIVMEYLEGQDLGTYLKNSGRLPAPEVAAMIGQVARALAKAHAAGIIHRDIKPDNIFLTDVEGGEVFVKLLDFGIAKAEDMRFGTKTTTGQVMGTPYYMSPEQLLGESIDVRTDIWSLGVVAFESLTGQRPFKGETIGALTLSIHRAAPKATSLVPDAPPAFDVWFERACAKDKNDRFASVRDAAQALYEACKDAGGQPKQLFSARPPMLSLDLSSTHALAGAPASDRPNTQLSSSAGVATPERRGIPVWMFAVGGLGALALIALFAFGSNDKRPEPKAPAATAIAPAPTPTPTITTTPEPKADPIVPAAADAGPAVSGDATPAASQASARTPAVTAKPRPQHPSPTTSSPRPTRPRDGFDDIK